MKDRDVRDSVWRFLKEEHLDDGDTLMLDELGILNGTARIDIAVINGEISGFELKSERDTLERLPAQRDLYNEVMDRISLVVAENHADKALNIIPSWWGVWIASTCKDGSVIVCENRKAQKNIGLVPETLCSFLWRDEALEILERFGASRGVKSKSREAIYKRMSQALDLDVIRYEVRRALKVRVNWREGRKSLPYGG